MIIVRLSGGMGNQMFQYALGRALSLKYNVPLKLDITILEYLHAYGFTMLSMTFRKFALDKFFIQATLTKKKDLPLYLRLLGINKLGIIADAFFRRVFKVKGKEKSFNFDDSILDIGPNAYLDGVWQSYKYFSKYSKEIRSELQIKNPQPQNIKLLGQQMSEGASVCVHIRRGDYVGHSLHCFPGKDYYEVGVSRIAVSNKIDCVYVFSDDEKWCRENIVFPFATVFVGDEYAGEDGMLGHFWLMQQCKYFIIANSSFSWWAAWLSAYPAKIVIAPNKWFNDATISTDDLIPPEWVRI